MYLCEFKASLGYRTNSRAASVTHRETLSRKQMNENKGERETSSQGDFIASDVTVLPKDLQNHEWEEKEKFELTKDLLTKYES